MKSGRPYGQHWRSKQSDTCFLISDFSMLPSIHTSTALILVLASFAAAVLVITATVDTTMAAFDQVAVEVN